MTISFLENKKFDQMLRKALLEDFENTLSAMPVKEAPEQNASFSPEFEQKMTSFIRQRKKIRQRNLRLAWAAILCVIITGFCISQSDRAVAAIRSFLKEVFPIETSLTPVTDEKAENVFDPDHPHLPSYLPSGFQETSHLASDAMINIEYRNSKNDVIYLDIYPLSSVTSVDTERTTWETIQIHGYEGEFGTNEKEMTYMLIWHDGNSVHSFLYQGQSDLIAKDIFLKMARSCYD